MTVAAPVVLGPSTRCDDHPFAHPDHIAADRAVLCVLARDYYHHIRTAPSPRQPMLRYLPRAERWQRRVVIPRPQAVLEHEQLALVGFFGRVNDQLDQELQDQMAAVGKELAEAVLTAEGVLGYVTHLLADERNYANLVVLSSLDVIAQWQQQPLHVLAAASLGPAYYQHVRIYHGSVPSRALCDEGAVRLEKVKYWDYRSDPPWRAVRTLG